MEERIKRDEERDEEEDKEQDNKAEEMEGKRLRSYREEKAGC